MGNLKTQELIVASIESDEAWKKSLLFLTAKLAELAVFKPTLNLEAETKLAWAKSLLTNYGLRYSILAIEQVKHSSKDFVQFGTIAEECRRIMFKESYSPYGDPTRLTITQLRIAAADGSEEAGQILKIGQLKDLKRLGLNQ
jgi:hypothetical protein